MYTLSIHFNETDPNVWTWGLNNNGHNGKQLENVWKQNLEKNCLYQVLVHSKLVGEDFKT